jgi:hypothetical protein
MNGRRAAGDLVEAIVDNMRRNLEPLKYTTLAPSRYTVYLSAAEHARLAGILPRLQAEAIRALDDTLEQLNRPSLLRRHLRWLPGGQRRLENAGPRWHVEFLADPDGEIQEDGDVIVHSDLVLPSQPELGVGERTRRITTVRSESRTTAREVHVEPAAAARPAVYARLKYEDDRGKHQHEIVSDSVTIGRGGTAYGVNLRVVTSEDVSREHARIRRDPGTGQFFLVDLSTLGTTLNGRHVPRGIEDRDGTRVETGAETQIPDRARIGLADTVFLDFELVRS